MGEKMDSVKKFKEKYIGNNVYAKELEYLEWANELSPYLYFWQYRYCDLDIKVYDDNGMKFVVRNNKRLYFPPGRSERDVQVIYNALLIEDDDKSPHKYINNNFKVDVGDILIDIGAAEAFFSLDNVDVAEHIYIFETQKEWIAALEKTFAPYKHKVTIINKFASNVDNSDSVRVDEVIRCTGKNIFVKIDVEGAEQIVMEGMTQLLAQNQVKLALCTYHKDNDADYFTAYFGALGYATQATSGYMLFPIPAWNLEAQFGAPTFRKGILRCWKPEYFDMKISSVDIYEHEDLYKLAANAHKRLSDLNIKLVKELKKQKRIIRHIFRWIFVVAIILGYVAWRFWH